MKPGTIQDGVVVEARGVHVFGRHLQHRGARRLGDHPGTEEQVVGVRGPQRTGDRGEVLLRDLARPGVARRLGGERDVAGGQIDLARCGRSTVERIPGDGELRRARLVRVSAVSVVR